MFKDPKAWSVRHFPFPHHSKVNPPRNEDPLDPVPSRAPPSPQCRGNLLNLLRHSARHNPGALCAHHGLRWGDDLDAISEIGETLTVAMRLGYLPLPRTTPDQEEPGARG